MNLADNLKRMKDWQIILLIFIVGLLVYFRGLNTPFIGDDALQIVDNIPVHSISNIKLFFQGSTFYNGEGLVPLTGSYYRPLMTTTFAVIYTIFGEQPLPFHLVQIVLGIGSAVFLYLFLTYSFKNCIALLLSLLFLVHPINSQVLYALPSMQDALFIFFGLFALWSLARFRSTKALIITVIALMLSLLSKESGILFVAMSFLLLYWFDRPRLYPFIGLFSLPFLAFLILKINAVGLFDTSGNAPISRLGIAGRLMTLPSIFVFYLFKLVFPAELASGYYWIYPDFSFKNVLLPLIVTLIFIALVIYCGFLVRKKAAKSVFATYVFFGLWWAMGMAAVLQILPLDLTASETWFYFPSIGLLGMAGIVLNEYLPDRNTALKWLSLTAIIILICLGMRTNIRAGDRSSEYTLATHDAAASKENFIAYNQIAIHHMNRKDYEQAEFYARKSVEIFPEAVNYNTLGQILTLAGDYPGAHKALTEGTKYQDMYALYANLSILTLHHGDPVINQKFLRKVARHWPDSLHPWYYLAILEYRLGNTEEAKDAIGQAYRISPTGTTTQLYHAITNDRPFNLNIE